MTVSGQFSFPSLSTIQRFNDSTLQRPRSDGATPFLFRTRLFGGGAEEDAAHLALGEIEDDAAVDRTYDKDAGITCFAIDMLGVSLTRETSDAGILVVGKECRSRWSPDH